jgi:TRAP transporter TAXI family solute receptor
MKTNGRNLMARHQSRHALLLSTALAAGMLLAAAPADAQQRKSIRWATSSVDSYGYKVAASMTKMVEEALGGEYTVTVNPYPQTTSATKAAMDGEAEIGYTADIGMRELYDGASGFRNYTPAKGKLVHTWYAYPMESFMAAPADKASQYKCLKDFSGKPVFYTPAGFMNWLNFQRINKTLGYEFKHVQIDPKTQSDAMQAGTIAGSVAYTVSGKSLAPYWKETEVRMDVKVINPCPDEVAKLKSAGLSVVTIPPKDAFTKDVGVKEILGVPILFAYNVRPDIPEDVVYKMLKAFYDNRSKLAALDPGFGALAADFIGLQVNGINANPDVPVHAGLAKFLKEQKAWNDKWKVAGSSS